MFVLNPILVVFNKVDITPPEQLEEAKKRIPEAHEMIAVEGVGVHEIMERAVDAVDLTSMEESVEEFLSEISKRDFHSIDE
jgi:50S ribosomal subunit-associated GTPase HflX